MSKQQVVQEAPASKIESIRELEKAFKTEDEIPLSRLSKPMKDCVTSGRAKKSYIVIKHDKKEFLKKAIGGSSTPSSRPKSVIFSPHINTAKK